MAGLLYDLWPCNTSWHCFSTVCRNVRLRLETRTWIRQHDSEIFRGFEATGHPGTLVQLGIILCMRDLFRSPRRTCCCPSSATNSIPFSMFWKSRWSSNPTERVLRRCSCFSHFFKNFRFFTKKSLYFFNKFLYRCCCYFSLSSVVAFNTSDIFRSIRVVSDFWKPIHSANGVRIEWPVSEVRQNRKQHWSVVASEASALVWHHGRLRLFQSNV